MKKIVVILLATALSLGMSAQPKDVVLVVTGDGISKEVATNNALRSAVEQAFGVFVSANTEILNDELVRDEIATITSGNIKSFKELSAEKAPSGDWFVSLQAEVSIGNLVSYAKSHGSSAEFAGNTFAANLRMRELNKQNEAVALENLAAYAKKMSSQMFDFKLTSDENPKYDQSWDAYVFLMRVEVLPNRTSSIVFQTIKDVIESLSLTDEEVKEYINNNHKYYSFNIKYFERKYGSLASKNMTYYLRNNPYEFQVALSEAITSAVFDFRITTNSPLKITQPIFSDYISTGFPDMIKLVDTWSHLTGDFERLRLDGLGASYSRKMRDGRYVFYCQYHFKGYIGWIESMRISNNPYRKLVNKYFDVYERDMYNDRSDIFFPGIFTSNRFVENRAKLSQSIFCEVPVIIKKEDLPKLTGFEVRRPEPEEEFEWLTEFEVWRPEEDL